MSGIFGSESVADINKIPKKKLQLNEFIKYSVQILKSYIDNNWDLIKDEKSFGYSGHYYLFPHRQGFSNLDEVISVVVIKVDGYRGLHVRNSNWTTLRRKIEFMFFMV